MKHIKPQEGDCKCYYVDDREVISFFYDGKWKSPFVKIDVSERINGCLVEIKVTEYREEDDGK